MAFEHYDKCSLLLPMDGANNGAVFDDWSVDKNTLARSGSVLPVTSTSQSKHYGSSGFFPSTTGGNQLSRLHLNKILAGSGAFTIAAWVRPGSDNTSYYIADSRANSAFNALSATANTFIFFLRYGTSPLLSFAYGASNTLVECTSNFTANDWHHCAVTRDADNTVRVFFNGIKEGESSSITNDFSNPYAYIGGTFSTAAASERYINDLIAITGVALWTDDFTPPDRLIGELSNANAANPVEDESGTPVERRIFVVPRCYPTRMFTTVSDVNGDFTLRAPATECSAFAIHEHEGSPIKNDLIQRVIPV